MQRAGRSQLWTVLGLARVGRWRAPGCVRAGLPPAVLDALGGSIPPRPARRLWPSLQLKCAGACSGKDKEGQCGPAGRWRAKSHRMCFKHVTTLLRIRLPAGESQIPAPNLDLCRPACAADLLTSTSKMWVACDRSRPLGATAATVGTISAPVASFRGQLTELEPARRDGTFSHQAQVSGRGSLPKMTL